MDLRAPSLNLFWTLRCCLEHLHPSLLLLGHTLLLLSVLVQTARSTSSAASGRCSRIYPSRGLVEGPVFLRALSVGDSSGRLLRSFSTWFRRRRFTATASGTSFCPGVLTASVSCALRLLTWPSACRARGTDFLSPLRCLTCVAVPT